MKKTNKVTCKVLFPVGTPKEDALAILHKYDSCATFANYYQEREVGCNKMAFGVTDLEFVQLEMIQRDLHIKAIEILNDTHGVRSKEGSCSNH
jgi:hypothetical protein